MTRNGNSKSIKTLEPSAEVSADQHRKLLQKINEEKKERKAREENRRQKTLERYTKEVEEKLKLEQEMKEKLLADKLKRH